MAIRSTGRRGLFGLLCGAPVAVVAAGANAGKTDVPHVIVTNCSESNVIVHMGKWPSGGATVDIIVEAVERKMAGRIARGKGSIGKAIAGA